MSFEAFDASVSLIRSLRPVLGRLETRDGSLALQIRRAAASVSLNIAEGGRRIGRDRKHLWRIAAGSAAEVRAALKVGEAFGCVEDGDVGEALRLVDRVLAMLWRLTR